MRSRSSAGQAVLALTGRSLHLRTRDLTGSGDWPMIAASFGVAAAHAGDAR